MTEADRKLLTEYMGECWYPKYKTHADDCTCNKCLDYQQCNRTFDTWKDFGELKEKIDEKGEWYATQVCNRMFRPFEFANWLIDKNRFPQLVVAWLKGRKEERK
jgi:hypothetical protein